MGEREEVQQQRIHETLETVLYEMGDLPEGHILAGWVVCFETAAMASETKGCAGSFYGPREMTTWRALGLTEWVSRFTLNPDMQEDD